MKSCLCLLVAVNSRGREDYSEGGGPVIKVTEGVSLAPAGLVSSGSRCQAERLYPSVV